MPSAHSFKRSRSEFKPPTTGSAGVPPLETSKKVRPPNQITQRPDPPGASLVSFRFLTLVVGRNPTQPTRVRQRHIPITLKLLSKKRSETPKGRSASAGAWICGHERVPGPELAAEDDVAPCYLKRYSRSSLVRSRITLSEPVTMESASLRFDSWRSAILSSIDSPETNL